MLMFLFWTALLQWFIAGVSFVMASTIMGEIAALLVGISGSILFAASAVVRVIERSPSGGSPTRIDHEAAGG